MSSFTCDHVRELLPERERDQLGAQDRYAVDAHLAVCAECRADAEVIGALREDAAPIRLPVGLETRVVTAVRRPAARRSWLPANLAIAASVVLALLASGVLLRGGAGPGVNGTPAGGDAQAGAGPVAGDPSDATNATVVVAPATREPLLSGVPALQELSLEELEVLLSELES